MAYQPADSLGSRTFCGLLVAQFLAAFNDQAIHAAAMFYAINTNSLSEATAITLMPILFYAPWALFCTVAGYLADRYSKRQALVFWKLAEVVICVLALVGFWLGSGPLKNPVGPFVVLGCVFLMGTHSAFFVPAKYGAMPEILQPHLLSRGNGLLESLSFLAIILGTVTGGLLSSDLMFKGQEYWIGVVLLVLAVIGAVASLLIEKMPAANPTRPFPPYVYKPLWGSLKVLLRSRPLALAVLGIAFFTFTVAFMRGSVYLLGESQVPRWSELKTSIIVGMSALGIGLGSPLAGYLSGGKVELGLVPWGAAGMILAACVAALALHWLPGLVACIILLGFCTGFFIVPLFTLLQHRAPKTSKGDAIATSNFINVLGAIVASLFLYVVVYTAHRVGLVPVADQRDLFSGTLERLGLNEHGRPAYFQVKTADGLREVGERRLLQRVGEPEGESGEPLRRIEVEEGLITAFRRVTVGSEVTVSTYTLPPTQYRPRAVTYYRIRAASLPQIPAYDNEDLPRYLFLVAGGITLLTLILLCVQLPDLFVRALLWFRSQGRVRLKVSGVQHLPTDGAVLLATNCHRFEDCLQVVAATDRFTRFIFVEAEKSGDWKPLLRYLARQTGTIALQPDAIDLSEWDKAVTQAQQTLDQENVLGVSLDGQGATPEMDALVARLRAGRPVPVVPVYCGSVGNRLEVRIGKPLPPEATTAEIRQSIHALAPAS